MDVDKMRDKFLQESSLSRLWKHAKEHDTGTVTAFRSEFMRKENQQRNKSLAAKLMSKGYQLTSVQGKYIENYGTDNEIEVGESVFFVVDSKDKGTLEKDLSVLGEEFDQDSVLYVPKLGEGNDAKLIGTSKKKDSFPGYGKIKTYKNAIWGEKGEFMTKIHGRPFVFENKIIREHINPSGYFGKWGCSATAEMNWRDL